MPIGSIKIRKWIQSAPLCICMSAKGSENAKLITFSYYLKQLHLFTV